MSEEERHPGAPPGDERPTEVDGTRMLPTTGSTGPDETRMLPPAGSAAEGSTAADGTRVLPAAGSGGPDATRARPGGSPAARDSWAARAPVRPPAAGFGGSDFTRTEWAPVDQEPQRAWWLPIVVGIVVLVLLGVLGVGVWLILQATNQDEPAAPVPPATAAPASTAPSSPAPSATTPSPTATEPTDVAIPALKGMSVVDARRALDRVGLTYRVIYRLSASAEPGAVIDTDPPEGRRVPVDTEVTLVVAAPQPSSPAVSTSATPDQAGDQTPR